MTYAALREGLVFKHSSYASVQKVCHALTSEVKAYHGDHFGTS